MEGSMKRLLAVLLLMLALSFPTFAGHTLQGGYACSCEIPGCIEDYPGECNGHGTNQQSGSPSDDSAALGIVIVALMLWLRIRA
jgi:hypothetical protein